MICCTERWRKWKIPKSYKKNNKNSQKRKFQRKSGLNCAKTYSDERTQYVKKAVIREDEANPVGMWFVCGRKSIGLVQIRLPWCYSTCFRSIPPIKIEKVSVSKRSSLCFWPGSEQFASFWKILDDIQVFFSVAMFQVKRNSFFLHPSTFHLSLFVNFTHEI